MSRSRFYFFPVICLSVMTLFSCRKKEDPVTAPQTGNLNIEFSNMVGNEAMNLGSQWYINAVGDSFQINTYKYYISNISVRTADGKEYTDSQSYHLIDEQSAASKRFTLTGLPAGAYSSITFMIGVDSAHNVSGAQSGALDPTNGMHWSWNTGYIMAKMEGISPSSPAGDHAFALHIAGYSGEFSVLKTVTLSFPEAANVSGTRSPGIHIFSDAQEWFKTPVNIDLATSYDVMTTGRQAKDIADNYADMFRVDHVDN